VAAVSWKVHDPDIPEPDPVAEYPKDVHGDEGVEPSWKFATALEPTASVAVTVIGQFGVMVVFKVVAGLVLPEGTQLGAS
jgi:hypothetical protein